MRSFNVKQNFTAVFIAKAITLTELKTDSTNTIAVSGGHFTTNICLSSWLYLTEDKHY